MPFLARSGKLHWTFHARDKMRFYRLSEARVKRVIHSPKRVEDGVAPNTVAMMQPSTASSVKYQASSDEKRETWKQEIWVMVQKQRANSKGQIVKIISAWRYPGMSKPKSEILRNFIRQEYKESRR